MNIEGILGIVTTQHRQRYYASYVEQHYSGLIKKAVKDSDQL